MLYKSCLIVQCMLSLPIALGFSALILPVLLSPCMPHTFTSRWFALMEMHLFVVLVLHMFDFELLDPVPDPVR